MVLCIISDEAAQRLTEDASVDFQRKVKDTVAGRSLGSQNDE